jgi:uncharacterized protein YbbC (DUF1343 family)
MNEFLPFLRGKRVGLVANQTSWVNGRHLIDTLISSGIAVKKIFVPEHGFRGDEEAGLKVDDSVDSKTGVPLISIYKNRNKPDSSELSDIDVIVFDIQDVGVRFFTYISTLHYVMESCAENHVELIVLDRPNPNGHYIDGPVLDSAYRSFVGMDPLPVVYGLTLGELAGMIKGECWINKCNDLKMKIIYCKNYKHSQIVNINIKPSPNLPNDLAVLLYPSLCFFEGTVISLGRGTPFPFQVYGHPTMKSEFSFIPRSIKESINPPLRDSVCYGIDLRKTSIENIRISKKINLEYILEAYKNFERDSGFFLKNNFIDKLAGTDHLRKQIIDHKTEAEIRESWQEDLKLYKQRSKKYIIYK